MSKVKHLAGLPSREIAGKGIKLIGPNTKAIKQVSSFNQGAVSSVNTAAKVASSVGVALSVLGVAFETYTLISTEQDFKKKC